MFSWVTVWKHSYCSIFFVWESIVMKLEVWKGEKKVDWFWKNEMWKVTGKVAWKSYTKKFHKKVAQKVARKICMKMLDETKYEILKSFVEKKKVLKIIKFCKKKKICDEKKNCRKNKVFSKNKEENHTKNKRFKKKFFLGYHWLVFFESSFHRVKFLYIHVWSNLTVKKFLSIHVMNSHRWINLNR